MQAVQERERGRIRSLDALRGIAALSVVAFHFTAGYSRVFSEPMGVTIWWGSYGVQLFFMVSGFVIVMTLGRTKRSSDFAVNRASRLLPTYWFGVTLALVVLAVSPIPGMGVSPTAAAVNYTMLQRYLFFTDVDPIYWTLAAELSFYASAFVLWRMGLLTQARLGYTLIGWVGLGVAWHFARGAVPGPVGTWGDSGLLWVHLFAFGIAALLYVRSGLSWQVVTVWVVAPLVSWLHFGLQEAAVVAVLGGVFLAAVSGRLPWLEWRPLLALGLISYPLYLVHRELGWAVMNDLRAAGAPIGLAIGAALVLVLAVAALVSRYLEQPALKGIRNVYRRVERLPPTPSTRGTRHRDN